MDAEYKSLVDDAAMYFIASKRLSKDFRKSGGEEIAKVISVFSIDEVKSFGDLKTAKSEVETLLSLGIKQNVESMAEIWRQSRRIRN